MTSRFQRLLAEIERPEPPQGLLEAVMERIAWERRAIGLKRRIALFGAITVALTAALAWTFSAVRTAMTVSGSLQYLALAFSDTRIVLANLGTYAVSVFESLPAGSLAAFLTVAFCFLLAARALVRSARQAYGPHHHAFHA